MFKVLVVILLVLQLLVGIFSAAHLYAINLNDANYYRSQLGGR